MKSISIGYSVTHIDHTQVGGAGKS
jgi:hypothetical protein